MYKYPDFIDVDLNSKLPLITILEEKDKNFFTDDYYKNLILSDPKIGAKLHKALLEYLNPSKQNEGVNSVENYKQIIINYWEFLKSIAKNVLNLTKEQKILFRFAALLPNALGNELKSLISKTIWDNNYNEPFIYFDEWIYGVNEFRVQRLAIDELIKNIKNGDIKRILLRKKEKLLASIDSAKIELKRSDKAKSEAIENLKRIFEFLFLDNLECKIYNVSELGIKDPYSEAILKPLNFANNYIYNLIKANRSIVSFIKKIEIDKQELEKVQSKIQNLDIDFNTPFLATEEVGTIIDANKLTIGKRGNNFPILLKNNIIANKEMFGSRERIMQIVKEIEDIQPKIFYRTYKGELFRIVPYFILIPSYGEKGICWEPIDVKNRSRGRGKIIIPMYAKDLKKAVVFGMGDFLWELAKEQASIRWMETGITGHYYEYYSKFIKKGNIKNFFLKDYYLWIEKESKGIQKLEKSVRGVMWRNSPFTKELKEELSKKSLVYKELLDKDKNIEISDGY